MTARPKPKKVLKEQLYARTIGTGVRTRAMPMGANQGYPDDDSDDDEEIDLSKIIPDDPLFRGTAADNIGNNPDMTTLLQDEEILKRFQDQKTADYLREIALDGKQIERLLETPEIKFLFDKIDALFTKTRETKEKAAKLARERFENPEYLSELLKAEKVKEEAAKEKEQKDEEQAKAGKS